MGIRAFFTKVFAVLLLFFVNSVAAAPDDPYYILRAGTKIRLKLDTPVSSAFSVKGDTFLAYVSKPVQKNGEVVLPIGIAIEGRVLDAEENGISGKVGSLDLDFETIRFESGETRSIDAKLAKPLKAGSRHGWQLVSILGGTIGGTLLGAATGKGRGALIGTGIGAAAGTGTAVLIKGENVGIASGEEFEIVLERDVTLPFREV